MSKRHAHTHFKSGMQLTWGILVFPKLHICLGPYSESIPAFDIRLFSETISQAPVGIVLAEKQALWGQSRLQAYFWKWWRRRSAQLHANKPENCGKWWRTEKVWKVKFCLDCCTGVSKCDKWITQGQIQNPPHHFGINAVNWYLYTHRHLLLYKSINKIVLSADEEQH